MTMMIPNSPGGGYDLTGRAAVRCMEDGDLTGGTFEVANIIGAGGSVATAQLMNSAGDEQVMMTIGLGVVGSLYSFGADYRLQDATPLALLIEESEGILVPADSPFETVGDFVAAWTADPSSVTTGGGSSPGGPDHLFPMQLAAELGIDPKDVRFVSYDGGGALKTALLGEKIDAGFSGLGEFEGQIADGELRVLAVSGEQRSESTVLADVPTLMESGIDFSFINWRGVLGPPDLPQKRRDELIGYLEELHSTPCWQDALAANGWTDAFITGDDFEEFLIDQDERVSTTLEELGLV
ncbi:MAG: tripartite tricarboxylate transporter substrate binding protein [Aeromicrobium sp.]|uniref:Bug family tripartite tricarboxylate transporter substrate binding protein n=1 Tax=Aeromicrobium sp. TaxID=1871063 RepID=UPI0039E3933C